MKRIVPLLLAFGCGSTAAPTITPTDAAQPETPEPFDPLDPAPSESPAVPGVIHDAGVSAIDAGEEPLPDPGALGPFAVGVKTIELEDPARDRRFMVDVWYPIDDPSSGSDNEYRLGERVTLYSVETPARRDAPPAPGSWPLIVFSHGFGGIRFQSYFLTEHLASHGFVVAAPDHPGNRLTDAAQLGNDQAAAQSAVDRPIDLAQTLDALIAGRADLPPIDPAYVGATGHSFGGWAVLELARRDPRVRAVFPLAPGFRNGATVDFVSTLARPILFAGGSVDRTCEFEENQRAAYDVAVAPKYLLRIDGAGHLDFSNLCDIALARVFVDDGCDPASIPPAEVHARTRWVATAFARAHLAGDSAMAALLDTAEVQSLGRVAFWGEE